MQDVDITVQIYKLNTLKSAIDKKMWKANIIQKNVLFRSPEPKALEWTFLQKSVIFIAFPEQLSQF